ncbi:MAG: septation protein A [Hyphomicrobiaceae bacterium]
MTSQQQPPETGHSAEGSKQAIKLAIDLGPLLVFFAVYMKLGIFWATGVLMVATVLSMVASRIFLGRISPTLVITTVLVVGFGALTLWFNDPKFIKLKPTIIYLMFAAALIGGHVMKKPVLPLLLGEALQLTQDGWRVLSLRWAVFFVALAALNEVVWRNFSEATWASFKVFGFLPLTILFFATQLGFIARHQLVATDTTDKSAH